MTNFEYIKNMTVEEMAEFINGFRPVPCEYCVYKEKTIDKEIICRENCSCGIEEWLESEQKGND